LDSLETQLRGLVKSIDQVSKQRAGMRLFLNYQYTELTMIVEMAIAAGEFAQTIADLSASNEGLGVQLAGALAGLATVERKAQELQDKQSVDDTMTIMSTGKYHDPLV
jgi:sorting nexin-1/2